MARKLTKKQKGFVKDYIATGNASEAAARNYNVANRGVAGSIGVENMQKPSITFAIEKALPDELLARTHLEGLEASKTVPAVGAAEDGEASSSMEVPDFPTRAKFLDMAYKIKGTYAPDKSVSLRIDNELTDREKHLASILRELLS